MQTVELVGKNIYQIDLSKYINLIFLNISQNWLSQLDMTQNEKIKTISASGNRIAQINISKNKEL